MSFPIVWDQQSERVLWRKAVFHVTTTLEMPSEHLNSITSELFHLPMIFVSLIWTSPLQCQQWDGNWNYEGWTKQNTAKASERWCQESMLCRQTVHWGIRSAKKIFMLSLGGASLQHTPTRGTTQLGVHTHQCFYDAPMCVQNAFARDTALQWHRIAIAGKTNS